MSRRISRDIDSVNENQDLWGTLKRSAAHPLPTLNLDFRPITHLVGLVYNFSSRINDLSVDPWPYYPVYPEILKHSAIIRSVPFKRFLRFAHTWRVSLTNNVKWFYMIKK